MSRGHCRPEDYRGMALSFSTEPQSVRVEILPSDSAETVFEGDAGELDQFSPPLSGRYEMRVTAQWVETSARRYSGRCVYSLDLLVKKEAEVLVSAQKVTQGGLFTVTVTNPEDPGSLKVTTGLGQASAFVKQQAGCVCLPGSGAAFRKCILFSCPERESAASIKLRCPLLFRKQRNCFFR